MDSLSVEPARQLESVASLTNDQAMYARGMACAADGTLYILVDSDETKQLLRYVPGGSLEELYDFFDRGPGDAAGVQRDLAIDPDPNFGGAGRLYTLDTLNDNMLVYDIITGTMNPMLSDSLLQSTLSNRGVDGTLFGGERVGLVVIK